MELHKEGWTKIDCIKLFRAFNVGMGLADAKYAVDAFLLAYGIDRIDEFLYVNLFINYINAFVSQKVKMDACSNLVWNKSPILSENDIRTLCNGG